MDNEIWLFAGFLVLIMTMLVLDLGVFHRKAHVVTMKEALIWVGIWISLALTFNVIIFLWKGQSTALQFLAGYLIEESLSVDNLFVFVIIFSFFHVPQMEQHRILFWGIFGALIMRGVMIFAGVALIAKFHWVLYLFGGLLILTAIRVVFEKREDAHLEQRLLLRVIRRFVPLTKELHGHRFFVRDGYWKATPLFMVLLIIEFTDLVFAIDSIPAVFAVSSDPFIIYTSNIFAIMGLRSLYFALAHIFGLFHYLKFGLAAILVFVGMKMLLNEIWEISIWASFLIIVSILAATILSSVLWPPKRR